MTFIVASRLCLLVVVPTRIEACTGPRNVAELQETLWGPSSGYKAIVRPSVALSSHSTANAERVEAQLYIHDLFDIDDKKQIVTIQAKQYSIWTDARLAWNGTAQGGCLDEVDFPGEMLDNLWRPDLFWLGLSEEVTQVGHYFQLRSDGRIHDNRLLFMKLRCNMDLRKLPYDNQTCTIRMGTFRENLAQVRLAFRDDQPIKMDEGVSSGGFELTGVSGTNPLEAFSSGKESRLDFSMHFARDPSYYEKYYFKPLCGIAMVSWLTFFVDRRAVPARATLALVCFLTTLFQATSLLRTIPLVPYDVLACNIVYTCSGFNMYSIFAFAMGNYLQRVQRRVEAGQPAGKLYYCCLRRNGKMTVKDEHVDIISRIVYPVAFAASLAVLFSSA